MAVEAIPTTSAATHEPLVDWDRLAARARNLRRTKAVVLYSFLIAVSLPIILPYFWLVTIAFSARTGVAETAVLWRSTAVVVPTVVALWLAAAFTQDRRQMWIGMAVITAIAVLAIVLFVGRDLHVGNFIFLWEPDFASVVRSRVGEVKGAVQFPNVWHAFGNSVLIAGAQTAIVVTVASLAAYYLSRFQFPGRSAMLRSLLVLHAFPVMTLIVPMFLMLYWIGLLDTLAGVILVLVAFELPFAIFIMKGFFDAVPWDIEMSALTDGASRRQAFVSVVLPQVRNGILAIAVFTFIRGWEEYIFVFTFLVRNTNWTMSLYMYWVRDDVMGVDYGVVSAVGVFYLVPSLILYLAAQRYLMQMSIGGVKG
ncbi:ABC transporter permease [Mesorhizobium sp. L-8-10]|uniref:carbohydrate ABC transporter permease n=1 Tax=unclassified Mesorhizobium TaxID=325217 RepID=UPI001927821A|nr:MULTISPECIES: carbohydrate ABC transporter permease [unclassified Mesorhizobium]BCH22595.1 ABC transporter permease [Mesorhizobium sp. L-8-3]BCH30397.1 ABC transporter permease [Mesorhizobium sp. L-8-10]